MTDAQSCPERNAQARLLTSRFSNHRGASERERRARPLLRAHPIAVEPVVGAVRAHAERERQVPARAAAVAELLERAAEAEVGVVVGRAALDHGRELVRGAAVAAAAEVRAPERLADRGLVRLEALRLLERDRRLRPMALRQQRRRLAGRARRRRPRRGPGGSCSAVMRGSPSAPRSSWTKSSTAAATVLLRGFRHVGSRSWRDDRDLVLLGVEADVGARDVVHDDRVEGLASELRPCPLDALRAVLGGEPDSDWPARRSDAASASTSSVRTRSHGRALRAPPSRSCASSRLRRAEVRDRGGHQQDVTRRRSARASRRLSSSAVWTATTSTPGAGGKRGVGGHHRHGGATARSLGREREPHASAGAVADEAHRVERLARAARGDQHPHARRAGAARPSGDHLDRREELRRLREPADPPLSARRERPRCRASTTWTPRARSVSRFACVAGCSYMRLFIAGASSTGLAQAR